MLYKVNPRFISMLIDKKFQGFNYDEFGWPQIVFVEPHKRNKRTGEVKEWYPVEHGVWQSTILVGYNAVGIEDLKTMSLLPMPGDPYPNFPGYDVSNHQVYLWKNKTIAFLPSYFVDPRDYPGMHSFSQEDYEKASRYPIIIPAEDK